MMTNKGLEFLEGNESVERELDDSEGLIQILSILSTKPKAKRGDLLAEWGTFLKKYSKFGTDATIKDTLRRRLLNLVDRELVDRTGGSYTITAEGMEYLGRSGASHHDPKREVMHAVKTFNEKQRQALFDLLTAVAPSRFEQLVGELLDAMGYQDVVVTKEAGDKGVDVVAMVQFGITTVKEVVQVKRRQSNINRPVLDQLRGALPYHDAIRGTIISLGDFTKGCQEAAVFPGAAPITLINGEKLLDLLIEHQIGVKETTASLHELDRDYFEQPSEQEREVEKALAADESGS